MNITAIKSLINKRKLRGASDTSLIGWLEHLKTIYKLPLEIIILEGLKNNIQKIKKGQ